MSALSRPQFHSEEAAFVHLEKIVWAGETVCPHCGGVDRITKVKANPEKRAFVTYLSHHASFHSNERIAP